eukprot:COSAG06_NODE_10178_length_1734_cov_1.622630_2_plen_207_part_00
MHVPGEAGSVAEPFGHGSQPDSVAFTCWPFGHWTHSVCCPFAYLPVPQRLHSLLPDSMACLGGHVSQAVFWGRLGCLPASHCLQTPPSSSFTVDPGHSAHSIGKSGSFGCVPVGHASHTSCRRLDWRTLPESHVRHSPAELSPVSGYGALPSSHCTQRPGWSRSRARPGGHCTHAVPLAAGSLPVGHSSHSRLLLSGISPAASAHC